MIGICLMACFESPVSRATPTAVRDWPVITPRPDATPSAGIILGKAHSQDYCSVQQQVCYMERWLLFTSPYGFHVDEDVWNEYELGDWYP